MFFGIDGCKGGWIVAEMNENAQVSFLFFETIEVFWNNVRDRAKRVYIDIPIGLPSFPDLRAADFEARKVLKARKSSIFNVPYREVLDFGKRNGLEYRCYSQANEYSKKMFQVGIPKQTWAIMPKIAEVDNLLKSDGAAAIAFSEIHPEILFWSLNNLVEMKYKKSTSYGFLERVKHISKVLPKTYENLEEAYNNHSNNVQPDDLVDALVACLFARVGATRSFPALETYDSVGLRMQILH